LAIKLPKKELLFVFVFFLLGLAAPRLPFPLHKAFPDQVFLLLLMQWFSE